MKLLLLQKTQEHTWEKNKLGILEGDDLNLNPLFHQPRLPVQNYLCFKKYQLSLLLPTTHYSLHLLILKPEPVGQ